MSRQRAYSSQIMRWMTAASLAIFLFVFPGMAQSGNGAFIFLLASGFLCDPGDSSNCPATTKANQGDSYEMSGAGTFDAQNKSVKAAGTYTHKSPSGNVLETGVWIASELLSFDSYGAAPAALMRQGPALGLAPFGPKPMPVRSGPMPTGGLAIFRILLLPVPGPPLTAVLQVNCALGDVPRERSVEGIRLKLENTNTEYSEEVSGRVMFLALRPDVSTPAEAQKEETAPETPEQLHN